MFAAANKSADMTLYKLFYFNAMGHAETARLIFAVAEKDYEDKRLTPEQWMPMKLDAPMGCLPLLVCTHDDGKKLVLCQSQAISRFLARRFDLVGGDECESALCDMHADSVAETYEALSPLIREHDPEKKKKMFEELLGTKISPFLSNTEKFLGKSKSGYLVGDRLTWADLAVFHFCWFLVRVQAPELGKKFTKVEKFVTTIESLPKVKAWIEKRPKTAL